MPGLSAVKEPVDQALYGLMSSSRHLAHPPRLWPRGDVSHGHQAAIRPRRSRTTEPVTVVGTRPRFPPSFASAQGPQPFLCSFLSALSPLG